MKLITKWRKLSALKSELLDELGRVESEMRTVDLAIKEETGYRQSWREEQGKIISERLIAGDLYKLGYTIKFIANEMGISEGQAASRVRQWKKVNPPAS